MVKRINRYCKYFPCHKNLQDCTFCFCPFYPCEDERLGEYVYSSSENKIWSCQKCTWIHRRKTVDFIFNLIKGEEKLIKHNILHKNKTIYKNLKNTGIIILSHGSRRKKANRLIPKLIKMVRKDLGINNVCAAYLYFSQPRLSRVVKKFIIKKCQRIIIVPFFLLEGNHVVKDIPERISQEKKKYPEVKFIYTENIGNDLKIGDIIIGLIKKVL